MNNKIRSFCKELQNGGQILKFVRENNGFSVFIKEQQGDDPVPYCHLTFSEADQLSKLLSWDEQLSK